MPAGTSFQGLIRFHNLRFWELGALVWAITWGGNDVLRHGLGMGKPFGYGQVRFRPDWQMARTMNWQEICDDPTLRDLPFKLETDRWGHIVMSPASNRHSLLRAEIQNLLRTHREGGYAFPKCSIQTDQGVKVADVAWGSDAFFRRNGTANPYPEAPEILVEVASPSNTFAELEEKTGLYFARGAQGRRSG